MKIRALSLALLAVCGCSARLRDHDSGPPDGGPIDASGSDVGLDAVAPDAPDAGALVRCDEEGEACCRDATCGSGLLCVDGICGSARCGPIGAPCCELHQCDPGALCESGTCVAVPCGVELGACCAVEPVCTSDLECLRGSCVRCGAPDEPCCAGDVCDAGLECISNLFGVLSCVAPVRCGTEGAECCAEGTPCDAGLGCTRLAGDPPSLLCLAGAPCGGEGRACCEGTTRCGPGLDCTALAGDLDRCQRCGEHELACCVGGDPPCGPGLTCSAATCVVTAP